MVLASPLISARRSRRPPVRERFLNEGGRRRREREGWGEGRKREREKKEERREIVLDNNIYTSTQMPEHTQTLTSINRDSNIRRYKHDVALHLRQSTERGHSISQYYQPTCSFLSLLQ